VHEDFEIEFRGCSNRKDIPRNKTGGNGTTTTQISPWLGGSVVKTIPHQPH